MAGAAVGHDRRGGGRAGPRRLLQYGVPVPVRNRAASWWVGTVGAVFGLLALQAGAVPGPLLASLPGPSLSSVVVLGALVVVGSWLVRRVSGSAWRWGVGVALAATTARLGGMSFTVGGDVLADPANRAWVVVHTLGTVWLVAAGVAALVEALDRWGARAAGAGADGLEGGNRLVRALRSGSRRRRAGAAGVVAGLLVLSRLPYLIGWWPGIVHFDTLRSVSYVRGSFEWEAYEPVGHSLIVGLEDRLSALLGLGDVGMVAIGVSAQVLASSAAFAFLLARMATWRAPDGLWVACLAWVALHPVISFLTVTWVKDVPFSVAFVVLVTCTAEVAFGPAGDRRWLWPVLTVAAVAVAVTRNNGVYVVALGLLALLVLLPGRRRRLAAVLAGVAVSYGLFVGPLYAVLDVHPGPTEELYSVPIQQLARIAKEHAAELTPAERGYLVRMFDGMAPEELARHYVPGLADPMKLQTRPAWPHHGAREFLAGWAGIVARFPGTALAATLANTAGYWDPAGASYDGFPLFSVVDAELRGVHLRVPTHEPPDGLARLVVDSGLVPTHDYVKGSVDDGYRALPALGLLMSPGFVVWLWVLSVLLVARCRDRAALAAFVPAGALLLTVLAGPVSGGQRYSLTLYMALPLAASAVAVAARRRGSPGRSRAVADPATTVSACRS